MNVWETLKKNTANARADACDIIVVCDEVGGAGGQMVCVRCKITGKKVKF